MNQRDVYGQNYRVKKDITLQDLLARTQHVIGREIEVIRSQLNRNGVDLLHGTGRFVDPHTVAVDGDHGSRRLSAAHIVIATGTTPARPASVEFDGKKVIDSDGILALTELPRSLVVVGAGVIG